MSCGLGVRSLSVLALGFYEMVGTLFFSPPLLLYFALAVFVYIFTLFLCSCMLYYVGSCSSCTRYHLAYYSFCSPHALLFL